MRINKTESELSAVKAALPLSIAFQTGPDGLSLFRLLRRCPRTLGDYPHTRPRQDSTPSRTLVRGVPLDPSGWSSPCTRYQNCGSRRHRDTVGKRWCSDGGLAVQARNCRRTRHRPACLSETETVERLSGLAGYSMM